jgi:hypothetical protein
MDGLIETGGIKVLADPEESAAEMVSIFRGAISYVYFSSFLLHLDVALPGVQQVTLRKLFYECGARGVKLYILYNPETAYKNLPPAEFKAQLPPSAEVHAVYGSGMVPRVARLFVSNTRYSNHHQKYLCADLETGPRFMLGGVDVDNCRATGWLGLNDHAPNFCWHEVSVSVPCSDRMLAFVRANFVHVQNAPPYPLTRGLGEYFLMTQLIANARSCIHMEAQTCISAESTANEVLMAVVKRVKRAFLENDRFHFMLITNKFQIDESAVVSWITSKQVLWSKRYLLKAAKREGVPASFLKSRVFIGYMEDPEKKHIKVHSNLLIQDGRRLLRSSSNFTDRSMSAFPCDNELGIAIQGDMVARLQQKLWRRYFMVPDHVPLLFTPEQAFEHMVAERGVVKNLKLTPRGDQTRLPDAVVNVPMDVIHLGTWFGGKEKIEWKVVPVE